MRKLSATLAKSAYLKNTVILGGATGFAQMITILASPVLTRLYSPSDLGLFGLFISFASFLSVLVTFKFEIAIPIPKEDDKGLCLLLLSIVFSIFMSVVIVVPLFAGLSFIKVFHQLGTLTGIYYLLPAFLIISATLEAGNYWMMRHRNFKTIAKSKLARRILGSSSQIGWGILYGGSAGLLWGDLIGRSASCCYIYNKIMAVHRRSLIGLTREKIIGTAKEFRRFPTMALPATALNTASLQLPVILLAILYGTDVAGWYTLAQRVFGIPMFFIMKAVADVYVGEVSTIIRAGDRPLSTITRKTAKHLALGGVLPIGLIALLSPIVFPFVFGKEWLMAGVYIRVLSVMFFVQFIVMPLSQTLNLIGYQHWQLVWDVVRFCAIALLFGFAFIKSMDPVLVIAVYSIVMAIAYIGLFLMTMSAVNKHAWRGEEMDS